MPRPQDKPTDTYIAVDMPCVGCGYNLRTLSTSGACPECAHPIEQTHAAAQAGLQRVSVEMIRVLAGILAWLPIIAVAVTIAGALAVGLSNRIVPMAFVFVVWLVLSVSYVVSSAMLMDRMSGIVADRGRTIPWDTLVFFAFLVGVPAVLVAFFSLAVSFQPELMLGVAGILVTGLQASTGFYVRSFPDSFTTFVLKSYATRTLRVATAACLTLVFFVVLASIVPSTSARRGASRLFSGSLGYGAILVVVGIGTVAHIALMFRLRRRLAPLLPSPPTPAVRSPAGR